MPNWTDVNITISGDPAALAEIYEASLNFQKLHPCPFITGEGKNDEDWQWHDGWYEWCSSHWGTKWPARGVNIDYTMDSGELMAYFTTAWSVPHGFLAYLTVKYPSLKIVASWEDASFDCVGEATYSDGNLVSKSIDPSLYKPAALLAFADSHDWFSYDNYWSSIGDSLNDDDIEVLGTDIEISVRKCAYEDFIKMVF